jgi:RHS repeat-associated protein
VKATYTYLADGTKLSAALDTIILIGDGNSLISGKMKVRNGFDYLGSFVYARDNDTLTFESASFGGGRINKTNNAYDINYFITDHLGSTRVIVDNTGIIKGQYNYYPFGKQWEDVNLMANTNRYTFSGKEKQTVKNLGYLDFGNRMYDSEIGRWFVIDRFAEKYYSLSPYSYAALNPVNNIDVNGDSVRIYTETSGVGHTWISTGEGNNMTVYSYGRYNGTNKGTDGSSNSLANGPGVLLKLTGEEAKNYNERKADNGMSVFVVTDVADDKVTDILDEKFNSSTVMPDNPQSEYYNNPSAHIVDEYKLFSNNCTTLVSDVLNQSGSDVMTTTKQITNRSIGDIEYISVKNIRIIVPSFMQNHLMKMSKQGESVYKTK